MRGHGPGAFPPPTVAAVPVALQDIPIYKQGLGTVAALNTVIVKPQVNGPLIDIDYHEGQFVNKGAVLADIDPRPFQVQVQQAQAALERDDAQLKVAQVNLRRDLLLQKAQVIAQQQLDAQKALVGQLQGSVAVDQSQLAAAKLNLSYTHIRAPISGIAGLRQVDIGNMVTSTDPNGIVVLTQIHPIAATFTLPEKDLQEVLQAMHGGHPLQVQALSSDQNQLLDTGELRAISNQINTTTGTEQLKAVFPNLKGQLWPNQFINVRLLLRTLSNATVIPTAAIERNNSQVFVYVIQQGPPGAAKGHGGNAGPASHPAAAAQQTRQHSQSARHQPPAGQNGPAAPNGRPRQIAVIRNVQVALTEGNLSVINGGLQPGELVVVDGQDQIRPNGPVNVQLQHMPELQLQNSQAQGAQASNQP